MGNSKLLSKWQVKIFILCWIAYACIYFGRVNLSIALPEIQLELGVSKGSVGIIGSLFFWVYGIGQLINGYLGEKFQARIFVFIGLFICAATNIVFGFANSLVVMIILWGINGYFQSMLWGPIVKSLSSWYPYEKRNEVGIRVSTSMVLGYIMAWGLSGIIISKYGWRKVFIIPGMLIFIYSIIWVIFMRSHPKDVGLASPNIYDNVKADTENSSMTLWDVIKKGNLIFIVIGCFAQGIIKDGISLWGPTFLMETHGLDMKSTTSMIMLIPIANFVGMMLAERLNKKLKSDTLTTIVLFVIGLFSIIGLVVFKNATVVVSLILLSISSASMFGANTILLGVIPMSFSKYGKASTVAGFLDFCSYLSSGFAAACTGLIVDKFGWNGVLIFWITITILGVISLAFNPKNSNSDSKKVSM